MYTSCSTDASQTVGRPSWVKDSRFGVDASGHGSSAMNRNATRCTAPDTYEVPSVMDCTDRTPTSPACRLNSTHVPAGAVIGKLPRVAVRPAVPALFV